MKTGIFYATSTGTTEMVANYIAKELNIESKDVHNVASSSPSEVGDYDFIILGTPTYGDGELQEDWYDFLAGMSVLQLKGKTAALFGLGDESMSDTFCNAVGILYDKLKDTGLEFVGSFNTYPYNFSESKAVQVEGAGAVGLLLDEVNRPEASEQRLKDWLKSLPR